MWTRNLKERLDGDDMTERTYLFSFTVVSVNRHCISLSVRLIGMVPIVIVGIVRRSWIEWIRRDLAQFFSLKN